MATCDKGLHELIPKGANNSLIHHSFAARIMTRFLGIWQCLLRVYCIYLSPSAGLSYRFGSAACAGGGRHNPDRSVPESEGV